MREEGGLQNQGEREKRNDITDRVTRELRKKGEDTESSIQNHQSKDCFTQRDEGKTKKEVVEGEGEDKKERKSLEGLSTT